MQEAAAGAENANQPAEAVEAGTPATVPAQGPLPTLLDTGTTAGDEGMEESQRKNKRSDGRSRSPTENTNDRRRKKGRAKEEDSEEDGIGDPIQCTQYSTRHRGRPGQSFHEMQAAAKADEKTKKAGSKNGTGWINNDTRWRQAERRQGAPRTPLGKKEESEEDRRAEPVDGGEETAKEDLDWLDEEAELVRKSRGGDPFCG